MSRPPARVVYVGLGEILGGGVVASQVVGPARAHARLHPDTDVRVVFLEGGRAVVSRPVRAAIRALRALWPEGRMAVVPYVGRLGRNAPGRSLALYVRASMRGGGAPAFIARNSRAALAAAHARDAVGGGRVLMDLHGHEPWEAVLRLGFRGDRDLPARERHVFDRARATDREGARRSDAVTGVTEGLVDYAVEELGAARETAACVPNCVEDLSWSPEDRRAARARWGTGAAPILIYSGRLGPERLPDVMLGLLAAARRRAPEARLVLLTYLDELPDLRSRMAAMGVPEHAVVRESLDRDGARRALSGGDAGICLYEPAPRYLRYGCPIKVPEYLAAGLALAVDRSVTWVADLVERDAPGVVLPANPSAEDLDGAAAALLELAGPRREEARARALDACRARFLWSAHLPVVRRLLGIGP